MKLLNEKHRVYEFELSDLTFKEIRGLNMFRNDETLNDIAMFYREDEDKILVRVKDPDFCIKVLELLWSDAEFDTLKIPHYKSELVQLLIRISKKRREKQSREIEMGERPKTPNGRFIAVDDSVIQICKIISVKPYGDKAIDILTTNKTASVRKIYPTSIIRDFELSRLKKQLLETA